MSKEIRIGEPSRCLSFFLMHRWRFLERGWTRSNDRAMMGLAAGGRLLSGAREYRGPSDAVNTQFSASRKTVCRLNQKFEALIWRLKILSQFLLCRCPGSNQRKENLPFYFPAHAILRERATQIVKHCIYMRPRLNLRNPPVRLAQHILQALHIHELPV
jgi:hypothetical protein